MERKIRILVADNHYFYRDGLRLLIDNTSDFELVAEVTTALDAINFAKQYQPDVILMELKLPPSDGISATKHILSENPNCHVLILTDSEEKTDIFNALQAGATGYLLKGLTREELQRSIRLIATGNAVFDRNITGQLNSLFNRMHSTYPAHHFPELTHRENEVLTFVAQGLRNKQIATECDIAEKTVRNHVTNILSKLGASSRSDAINRLQESRPSIAIY